MSMGNLGIRIRYQAGDEDSFTVEALLPIKDNVEGWQKVGLVYTVDYEGFSGWEFEEPTGSITRGIDRKAATAKAMISMGHARRPGDVLEDIPKEDQANGRRRRSHAG